MAKPRILVSSTYYDLKNLREDIEEFINDFGYEPVFSESSNIFYDPREHTHVSCIKAVEEVDMVIFIIGGRFGEEAINIAYDEINFDSIQINNPEFIEYIKENQCSITQMEILKAIECNIPVYTLIDQGVFSDYNSYQKNKDNKSIIYASIEKNGTGPLIFELINLITKREINNVIQSFNTAKDIKDYLKKQWAFIFKKQLTNDKSAKKKSGYVTSNIVNHNSHERRKAFEELFTEVDDGDEIRILGTGVTNFLNHTENVETYLKNNNHINILLINDQIIKADWACSSKEFLERLNKIIPATESKIISELEAKTNCPLAYNNILVDKNHFNNYYKREDYIDEVRNSYDLISKFKKKIISKKWSGTLQARHFHSFVPMSITAILPNHSSNRKLLAEFIIPFTDKRILLKSSLKENKDIYDLFINFFDETWKKALPLSED